MSIQHEAREQEALFRWADFAAGTMPELKLLYHIPNGGSRNKAEAANLKRQGVKAGVPDLFLPVPRGGYHGLYIELKFGKKNIEKSRQMAVGTIGAGVLRDGLLWLGRGKESYLRIFEGRMK